MEFLRLWAVERPPRPPLDGIEFVGLAGSKLPDAAARALDHETNARVRQRYGMTEAMTSARQTRHGHEPLQSVGRPTPGVRVWIRQQANGAAGEIMVVGPNVSLGYWGEPPRRRSEPLATGDAGHIDPAGNLFIHGRIREVITVAGRKVAPWVVAGALQEHASVQECVVFGTDDALRGSRVAAAIVTTADVDRRALGAHCRGRLEAYEVPHIWVFVPEIPLATNGKPDVEALRRVAASRKTKRKLS